MATDFAPAMPKWKFPRLRGSKSLRFPGATDETSNREPPFSAVTALLGARPPRACEPRPLTVMSAIERRRKAALRERSMQLSIRVNPPFRFCKEIDPNTPKPGKIQTHDSRSCPRQSPLSAVFHGRLEPTWRIKR